MGPKAPKTTSAASKQTPTKVTVTASTQGAPANSGHGAPYRARFAGRVTTSAVAVLAESWRHRKTTTSHSGGPNTSKGSPC